MDAENLSQNNGNPAAIGTAAQGGNGLGASEDLVNNSGKPNGDADQSNRTLGIAIRWYYTSFDPKLEKFVLHG